MNTQAIDVITIMHALQALEDKFLGKDRSWIAYGPEQTIVFELYRRLKNDVRALQHLKSKASTDWNVLNNYLDENGFDKMFAGPLNGIGAVSILDMLVEWLKQGTLCNIYAQDYKEHEGFEIEENNRRIYKMQDQTTIAELLTKSGDSLWLTMPDSLPTGSLDMIRIAFSAMRKGMLQSYSKFTAVQVPEISIDLKPDISFLTCAETIDAGNQKWFISEAYQQFKLKMNREGARAKVATGIAMRKGVSFDEPQPLVFNRPFMGWFTQNGSRLPIAIFYADYDVWRQAGDLRSM